MMTPEERKKRKEQRCRHFNGIQNVICEAKTEYRKFKNNLPCFGETDWPRDNYSPLTTEELAEKEVNSIGGISYVEWVDSSMLHGWSDSKTLEHNIGLGLCKTVGFLVHEDEEKIVLALNAATDDKTAPFGEIINIPQSCVRAHYGVVVMNGKQDAE